MKLLRLALVPFALLCVAIIRLASGRIRLGILQADRLGHLAGNTAVYLCERDASGKRTLDIWCSPPPANAYLLRMFRRVMWIDRSGFALIVLKVNRLFSNWRAYEIQTPNLDRDVGNLFEKQPPDLWFTESEQLRGRAARFAMGIPNGAKWVCLIVRDGAFLPELGYHAFRDSRIEDYLLACNELVKRGYYVIRMGAKVDKRLMMPHPQVIDYATNGMRSEFMDLYLGAHCEFCISTGTGFDAIPYIFRRPIVYVNYVPLEYLFTFVQGSLAIWKHHMKDGKRMTVAEIVANGAGHFMSAQEYEDAGITLVDNTPQEIADVVLEMADRTAAFVYMPNDEALGEPTRQEKLWSSFPRSVSTYTGQPLHGEIRMRIGSKFLAQYADPQERLPELYQQHVDQSNAEQWERAFHGD